MTTTTRWGTTLGAACLLALAAACSTDVIGEQGDQGEQLGQGGTTAQGGTTSQGGTTTQGGTTSMSSGANQGCFGLDEGACGQTAGCVPLLRNDVVLPGTPPPPPDTSEVDPLAPCCWGCEEPACVTCHQPIFQGCISDSFCQGGLPAGTCGYIQGSACP